MMRSVVRVDGIALRSIWVEGDAASVAVAVIDQRRLPGELVVLRLRSVEEAAAAIRDMAVRGAPLIGVTAAFGIALALRRDATQAGLDAATALLQATRPTAVNLRWALVEVRAALAGVPPSSWADVALARARAIADADVETCRRIGEHGLPLLVAAARGGRVRVLTHCNAGWLATVDWGTALAPVYLAHERGLAVEVWVSETRPRNQGALTAWELGKAGIRHTVIADSAAGHVLQHGLADVVLVGADRVTSGGDVANKIGTYLKALSARAHGVPFYVAAPASTIDFQLRDGASIPIEERDASEVTHVGGVALYPTGTPVKNWAFDVTPAALVTGLVTERGVCAASADGIAGMFPEGW
jgi:methylthioribose-1-phosphate isomerase